MLRKVTLTKLYCRAVSCHSITTQIMIRKLLFFTLLVSSGNLIGQDVKFSNVKPAILKFYEYIYQDSSKSTPDLEIFINNSKRLAYHFQEIKKQYYADLTQGLTMDKLKIVISNLRIHYDGDINTQYAILKFPNNKKVYFELNADSIFQENYPAQIYDLYLSNGISLVDTSDAEKLYFRGLLNPQKIQSSLNVHERPVATSTSINVIRINQLFYFTPSDSEWCEVFSYEDQKPLGFIKKDFIIMFENFPKPIKDKINRESC
jgi:hypothetical protein